MLYQIQLVKYEQQEYQTAFEMLAMYVKMIMLEPHIVKIPPWLVIGEIDFRVVKGAFVPNSRENIFCLVAKSAIVARE